MKIQPLILNLAAVVFLFSCQSNPAETSSESDAEPMEAAASQKEGDFTISYSNDEDLTMENMAGEEPELEQQPEPAPENPAVPKFASVQNLLKSLREKPQSFTASAAEDFSITGAQGTKINFAANSLVLENGQAVNGEVTVKLEEFYSTADVIKAQLTTSTTKGKVLETAGMIKLQVFKDGRACKLKDGRQVEIEFATDDLEDMQLFDGQRDENGNMQWEIQPQFLQAEAVDIIPVENRMSKERLLFLNNFIRDFSKNVYYPQKAADRNVQGVVYAQFFIDRDGRIRRPRIARSPDNLLSKSVLYALQTYPRLDLESYDYVPVNVPFTIPVKFQFEEGQDLSSLFPDEETAKAIAATEITRATGSFTTEAGYSRMLGDSMLRGVDTLRQASSKVARAFSSSNLGWINCDRFLNGSPRTDIYVNVSANRDYLAYMIFEDLNSVLSAADLLGEPYFYGVPTTKNVTVVLLKLTEKQDQMEVAFKQVRTEEDLEVSGFEFETMSLSMLENRLNQFGEQLVSSR